MKPYYHAHESAYQQIKSKGFVGWDNAKTLADLGDKRTNEYLRRVLSDFFPVAAGKRALDIGCGSGTTAFILAEIGFDVTGVDISTTAIQMAQELARQQNLKINFAVGDVLELENLGQKFDVIYDSHCLHCIVFEEDRHKVLVGAKKSLTEKGIFILDTMVMPETKYNPGDSSDTFRFDEDFILWHKTKPSTGYGIMEKDGQHWCAQRRIYPPQKVLDEAAAAGLNVISSRLDLQDDGQPSMLRLVLIPAQV